MNADATVSTAPDQGFVTIVSIVCYSNCQQHTATKNLRMSLIGVRSVSTLPIGTKRPRTKSVFGSRFSPYVSAKDTENCFLEQLKLSSVTCTWLRTKFNSHASFHVLVNEEGFPLINNTGVWPSGCLIAPLFGRLSAEQI
jgi:hypothetical protein